jgi:hypothetical protein
VQLIGIQGATMDPARQSLERDRILALAPPRQFVANKKIANKERNVRFPVPES